MHEPLKEILVIQELDIKMIRLMRLKNERQKELDHIHSLREDLGKQLALKDLEIQELKKEIRIHEGRVSDIKERVEKLESQQNKVKKVEEFNALSQEITQAGREKNQAELRLNEVLERLANEEEMLESLQQSLETTSESSKVFEAELSESIERINEEGKELLAEREKALASADADTMHIYEKLLRNKKDRVIVPIENRTCSGCHIVLTAQHENLVRKGERLVFCEHCSRILYWQESDHLEGTEVATKRRRRRSGATV